MHVEANSFSQLALIWMKMYTEREFSLVCTGIDHQASLSISTYNAHLLILFCREQYKKCASLFLTLSFFSRPCHRTQPIIILKDGRLYKPET